MPDIRAVSLAAPAFNEADGIHDSICHWLEFLRKYPGLEDFEVVVCNDGSTDATGAILDDLALKDCRVRPVHHQINQGAAAALSTAIHHTTLPWVLLTDADGQYRLDSVDKLIRAIQSSDERAAIGVRRSKRDSTFTRFGSWLSGALCNWFHGTRYRDFNCALKLIDGYLLRRLRLEAKGLNYSSEVTSKLIDCGVRLLEVEVEHHPRSSGRSSSQNLRAALHRILFVLYLGFRQFLIRHNVLQRQP